MRESIRYVGRREFRIGDTASWVGPRSVERGTIRFIGDVYMLVELEGRLVRVEPCACY